MECCAIDHDGDVTSQSLHLLFKGAARYRAGRMTPSGAFAYSTHASVGRCQSLGQPSVALMEGIEVPR